MHKDVSLSAPPRRKVGALAIIRNHEGHILLVDPHYRDGMTLPGGGAKGNEYPHDAVVREVEAETGLKVVPRRLLVMDVVAENVEGDVRVGIDLVFDCGTVDTEAPRLAAPGELKGYRWAEWSRLPIHTARDQYHRIREALLALEEGRQSSQYIVNGRRVSVVVNENERPIL
ncbi:NUDIX domain-containing protein [Streptomyces sp. NPDC017941]|uniref:NUDIX domain-containing protein n=1 Tax=Streptomyces sp. NPDC017941 TaxID=3365018 RepID=UPI0037B3598E